MQAASATTQDVHTYDWLDRHGECTRDSTVMHDELPYGTYPLPTIGGRRRLMMTTAAACLPVDNETSTTQQAMPMLHVI